MGMPIIVGTSITRAQAITDIIQSVALEETALSHILNAEGEKIQKALKIEGIGANELLAINQSVEDTIGAVTRLEMILGGKLGLFKGCICQPPVV